MWKWIPAVALAVAFGVGAASGQTSPAKAPEPAATNAAGSKPAAKPTAGAPAANATQAPKPEGGVTPPAGAKPGTTPPAAAKPPTPPAPPKPLFTLATLKTPAVPAATVNGEAITVGELMVRLANVGGSQILDRLIQERILKQEARRNRIVITEKEIKDRVDQNFNEFQARFGTTARFDEYLQRQHLTRETIRRALRPNAETNLLTDKLREKVTASAQVPDSEIADFHQKQQWQFTEPETAKISHILVAVNSGEPADDEKARAKAEEILGRVKATEGKNFAEVAKEASDDPETKEKGGELAPLRRPSFFGISFDQAVFGASPGLVPQVVRSVRGWHVIMLREKSPSRVKTLDEVKGTIKDRLLQQKRAELFRTHMEKLQKDARTDLKFQF